MTGPADGARARVLTRRVRLIVCCTIGYNVLEAVVSIASGVAASSAALVAFGLDSTIEVLSAAAVAWQFAAPDPRTRERAALRAIAISFFGLAAYVSVDSVLSLTGLHRAQPSPVGIGLAVASLIVMPVLSLMERRTGRELGSPSVVSDSKQTLTCSYLSAALLVGLGLNAILGWWWADGAVGLLIAVVAIHEGLEAWRGEACATPISQLAPADSGEAVHRAGATTPPSGH